MGERSKVYMTDLRCRPGVSLLNKLEKLMRTAGIGEINFERKLVAIKMHFGEPGNLAFLRPNYAKVVADVVKSLGGVPFLTDCNTLYPGRRKNALEHLDAAYENGFSPLSTGCQVIIGLRGNDDVEVPVEGAEYIQTAKIGKAIMEADVIISLSHFKGHEQTGFGGAIKNLGMGCGSRRGKMEQHAQGKPMVAPRRCVGCRRCATQCAHGAITFGEDRKASIDWDKCVGCGRCIAVCNTDAIRPGNDAAMEELGCRMAEYAKAVVDGRPQFHISLVIDVSPYCDCHGENDLPIVPDVGMFASFDPVALDQACADACGKQPPIPGSHLDEQMHREGFCDKHDHFINSMPDTDWRVCLAHCEKIGIGTRSYELVEVK